MNILFDLSAAQPINKDDFHGGSEYCKSLFIRLCEKISNDVQDVQIDVFYNYNKAINNKIFECCEALKISAFNCKNNNEINLLLNNKHYNLFYTALPYSYTDLKIPEHTKFIYTIHGLRSLECPWDFYIRKYNKSDVKLLIKHFIFILFPQFFISHFTNKAIHDFNILFSITKNKNIITVSNHSKHALSYFFPNLESSDIKVFYSPAKQTEFIPNNEFNLLDSYKVKSKKYILMICGDRFEKGVYRACKALSNLFSKKNPNIPGDLKVVIAGITYDKHYKLLIHDPDKFVFLKYIPSNHLEVLYKNAHLFIYPSLNEGFGYPPLEAMKYGTLCACSANSALTEIFADAVLYFNPYDETEIGIRILQSFDKNIQVEKKEKMELQYKKIHQRQEDDLNKLVQFLIGYDIK
jgi:hypothetical protein